MALFFAQLAAGGISHGPRELGTVVLQNLNIKDGKVIIEVATGGCTDKAAIKGNVQGEKGVTERAPHYVVTFERVRVDDCKALPFDGDGVVLEYDLADDLGIAGLYTLSVTNGVFPRSSDSVAEEMVLKRELITTMVHALAMESRAYEEKLKTAKSGVGPASNVAKFTERIAELKTQQESFQKMEPYQFALGTAKEESPEAFGGSADYGPVIPCPKKIVQVVVKEACREGSILEVEGMTKSGPFYHLAGMAGNDYGPLKPGSHCELTLYLLYKRAYFGPVEDYYVYVADVK
jgi:hypothetical protein